MLVYRIDRFDPDVPPNITTAESKVSKGGKMGVLEHSHVIL